MFRAMTSGALTAIGMFLALWAVYRGVRLDWPETALLFGVVSLTIGLSWMFHFISEVFRCEEED